MRQQRQRQRQQQRDPCHEPCPSYDSSITTFGTKLYKLISPHHFACLLHPAGEAKGRSLLGKDEPALWYEAAAGLPQVSSSSGPPLSETASEALRSRAEALLEREGQLFEKEVAGRNAADARWLAQVCQRRECMRSHTSSLVCVWGRGGGGRALCWGADRVLGSMGGGGHFKVSSSSGPPLSETASKPLHSRAEALLGNEGQLFEKEVAGRNAADARWLAQVCVEGGGGGGGIRGLSTLPWSVVMSATWGCCGSCDQFAVVDSSSRSVCEHSGNSAVAALEAGGAVEWVTRLLEAMQRTPTGWTLHGAVCECLGCCQPLVEC
jgi:hypothetical protein